MGGLGWAPFVLVRFLGLERDDDCLNRFWDSLLVCFLIQAVGWVVEAGSDDQTLFYGFA